MSQHHLQIRLREVMKERATAAALITTIEAKRDELETELEKLTGIATEAQQAATTAAGRHAVGELDAAGMLAAQKAHRKAIDAFDDATLLVDGVSGRLAVAEKDLDFADREVARVASELAVVAANAVEAEAATLARGLGSALARHRRLAQLACTTATAADGTGRLVEPIDSSSPRPPMRQRIDELLVGSAPTLAIDDLLSATIST